MCAARACAQGGHPTDAFLHCHLKSATPWLLVNRPRRPGLSARSPGQLEHAACRPPGECSWLAAAQSLSPHGQTEPRGRAFESARQRLYGETLDKSSQGGGRRIRRRSRSPLDGAGDTAGRPVSLWRTQQAAVRRQRLVIDHGLGSSALLLEPGPELVPADLNQSVIGTCSSNCEVGGRRAVRL